MEEMNERAQIPKWMIISSSVALACLIALGIFLLSNYTATAPSTGNNLHGYYGTLGDYIGGIMNPLMTFITVLLLLYTINQNQKIIGINNKELKNSTKALEDTAITSNAIFQMDMIEKLLKQFREIMAEDCYQHEGDQYDLISIDRLLRIMESISDPAVIENQEDREECTRMITGFRTDCKNADLAAYKSCRKIAQIYAGFFAAMKAIVENSEDLAGHFKYHEITINLIRIQVLLGAECEDIPIAAELNKLSQKTQSLLHPLLGNMYP